MSNGYTGELFGRDKILNYLSKRFDTAMTGKGCIDLLYGDAGIGKTAIINKFISMHPEVQSLYVQCSALTDADDLYKPCSDLLNSIESIKWQDESKVKKLFSTFNLEKVFDVGGKILGFIPGLELPSALIDLAVSAYAGDMNPEVLAESYKNDKVKLYSEIILGLSMEKPLIVVFDDLHWADRGTINVIKHIFQIMLEAHKGGIDKKFNLLLIGSLRDAEAKADSLHNGINEMFNFMDRYNVGKAHKLMVQHEVMELSNIHIQSLITYNFDNDEHLSKGLKRWLYDCSNGNPLLLSNLIDVLREYGAVECSNSGWIDFNEVSYTNLKPVLKGRMLRLEKQGAFKNKSVVALEALRNLNDLELKILYVASIFKEYFTIESLAHVCKIIESDLYWPINRLVKMGFISELGEFDNGLELQNRYHIKSKGLIEALRHDMPIHQVTYYEESLGDYYAKKINAVDYMEEAVYQLESSDIVSKVVISDKYHKIHKVRDFYHKMASYHYMNGKNSLKAINHGLYGVERLVERYKTTKKQMPSPLELDGLRKTIESQIVLYDKLFDHVIDELILAKNNHNELIQQLKIRALKSYAEFYACFKQYTKAGEYLNTALMLTRFTASEIDDAELMLAVAEIYINSGNHANSLIVIGNLLDYINENALDWEKTECDAIIDKILALISVDSVLQAKYISRVTDIAVMLDSKIAIVSQFLELKFYLDHNKLKEAKALIKQIHLSHSDIIGEHYLGNVFSTFDSYKIPRDEVSQVNLLGEERELQYNFKVRREFQCRFNACNLLLPVLLKEIKNIDDKFISQSILNILRMLGWLKSFSRLKENIDISRYSKDDYPKNMYEQRVKDLKGQAEEILKSYEPYINIQSIVSWFTNALKSGKKISERDEILRYLLVDWSEYVQMDYIQHLFDISMNSNRTISNYTHYEKNIFAWYEYYIERPNDELARLIVNSLKRQIEYLDTSILATRLISKVLFANKTFMKLIDVESYANIAINNYLKYGEYDKAKIFANHIEGDSYTVVIDKIHTAEYEEMDGKANDIFSYEGEDQFSRYITAEKLFNRADSIILSHIDSDILESLQLYVKAYNLMQDNEYAETELDDVCDKIAASLGSINDISIDLLAKIFGKDEIQSNTTLTKLFLQFRYQHESLLINQRVGDINRSIECLVNMVKTIQNTLDYNVLTLDRVNEALESTGFTVDSLLAELHQTLVDNMMFDKALALFFDFAKLSQFNFVKINMIPTILSTVNTLIKHINNSVLTDFANEFLLIE